MVMRKSGPNRNSMHLLKLGTAINMLYILGLPDFE